MTNTTKTRNITIRLPIVAGTFYSANPEELKKMVLQFLNDAAKYAELPLPKAIIAPHAGYVYSGPIAGSAYACLKNAKNNIKNVVILAPSHRYPVSGIAITKAAFFATPLGQIPVNQEALNKITDLDFVKVVEAASTPEHAIEVQLPFLQLLLENFSIIPILVGNATTNQTAEVIEKLWGEDDTLIVISSDLSHYYPYAQAKMLDSKAAEAILALNPMALKSEMACGHTPIRGFLTVAAKKKLRATQLDLRNSGDTSGFKDQVVGYGAFHFNY